LAHCRQSGYVKRRNRKTKKEVTTQLERINKVPALIKAELDGIRSTVIETAAMEVLLREPFPPTAEVEGIKHAIVVKVMNKKNIKGNPADNVAYLMEQKAVSNFSFSVLLCLIFFSNVGCILFTQMKDMLSSPKSSLLFQCIPLFNSIYHCIDVGGIKKPDGSEKQRKRVREYFSHRNRFIFKSTEDDMQIVLADPSTLGETDESFKVCFFSLSLSAASLG
jgi:hypothetical protein